MVWMGSSFMSDGCSMIGLAEQPIYSNRSSALYRITKNKSGDRSTYPSPDTLLTTNQKKRNHYLFLFISISGLSSSFPGSTRRSGLLVSCTLASTLPTVLLPTLMVP